MFRRFQGWEHWSFNVGLWGGVLFPPLCQAWPGGSRIKD